MAGTNSSVTETQAEFTNLKPALIIGVGGTGIRMVAALKKKFKDEFGVVPAIVKFLALDCDQNTFMDVNVGSEPQDPLIGSDEFFPMTIEDVESYIDTDAPYMTSWVPQNMPMSAIIDGAGMMRPRGRLALFYNYGEVYHKISVALSACKGAKEQKEAEKAGFQVNPDARPVVYIVTSVCGGTGSGVFLDIAYMARKAMKGQGDLNGLLFLPGLFEQVNSYFAAYMKGNAYAALKELDHFMSEKNEFIQQYDGMNSIDIKNKKAFDLCFLFNNKNMRGDELTSIESIVPVVANALFIHLQNPVTGGGQSIRVNMQMHLNQITIKKRRGTYYSSLGASMLVSPAKDIVKYCTARMATDLLDYMLSNVYVTQTGRGSAKSPQNPADMSRTEVENFVVTEGMYASMLKDSLKHANIRTTVISQEQMAQYTRNELPAQLKSTAETKWGEFSKSLETNLKTAQSEIQARVINDLRTKVGDYIDSGNYNMTFVQFFLDDMKSTAESIRVELSEDLKTKKSSSAAVSSKLMGQIKEVGNAADSFVSMFNRNRMMDKVSKYIASFRNRQDFYKDTRVLEAAIDICNNVIREIEVLATETQRGLVDVLRLLRRDFELEQQSVLNDNKGARIEDLFKESIVRGGDVAGGSDFEKLYKMRTPPLPIKEVFAGLREKSAYHTWPTQNRELIKKTIKEYGTELFGHYEQMSITDLADELEKKKILPKRLIDLINEKKDLMSPYITYNEGVVKNDSKLGVGSIMIIGLEESDCELAEQVKSSTMGVARTGIKLEIVFYDSVHGFPLYSLKDITEYCREYYDQMRDWPFHVIPGGADFAEPNPDVKNDVQAPRIIFGLSLALKFIEQVADTYEVLPETSEDERVRLGRLEEAIDMLTVDDKLRHGLEDRFYEYARTEGNEAVKIQDYLNATKVKREALPADLVEIRRLLKSYRDQILAGG